MEHTDLFLQTALGFHILTTSVALFLLAPVAIFATKGGRWHIRAGKYFYWTVIIGSVSGIMLLFDPDFIDRWLPSEGAAFEESIGPWFAGSPHLMKDLFFIFAAVAALVSVISGARVWTRVRAAQDRVISDWRDWLLSLSMAGFALFWATIGAYDLGVGGLHGERLLISSAILFGFSVVDVWTYRARPSPAAFPWYALHAAKMSAVVVFLLLAYQFHLKDILPGPLKNPYIMVGLFILVISAFFLLDRRRPSQKSGN
jgi:hypothetical protein